MLRPGLLFCLLLASAPGVAGACVFVPDSSLCGLALDAGQTRFDAVLGKPDGTLGMGDGRRGVLYGRHLLIVFEADRAVEVYSWARTEPDFLKQVGEPRALPLRLTLGNLDPWSRSRQQVDLALQNRPSLAADTGTETRALGRSKLTIRYRPGAGGADKPAQYRVDALQLILSP